MTAAPESCPHCGVVFAEPPLTEILTSNPLKCGRCRKPLWWQDRSGREPDRAFTGEEIQAMRSQTSGVLGTSSFEDKKAEVTAPRGRLRIGPETARSEWHRPNVAMIGVPAGEMLDGLGAAALVPPDGREPLFLMGMDFGAEPSFTALVQSHRDRIINAFAIPPEQLVTERSSSAAAVRFEFNFIDEYLPALANGYRACFEKIVAAALRHGRPSSGAIRESFRAAKKRARAFWKETQRQRRELVALGMSKADARSAVPRITVAATELIPPFTKET